MIIYIQTALGKKVEELGATNIVLTPMMEVGAKHLFIKRNEFGDIDLQYLNLHVHLKKENAQKFSMDIAPWVYKKLVDTGVLEMIQTGMFNLEKSLIEKIEDLFNHETHKFIPLQLRLNLQLKDQLQKAVCTIYNNAYSFTIRIEFRSKQKSLRDVVLYLEKKDSPRGFIVSEGELKTLVWFLFQPFTMVKAGNLQSCDNFKYKAADFDVKCSDFYFVRAGRKVDGSPKSMSKEMMDYVKNEEKFLVPQEIRTHVITLVRKEMSIGNEKTYLTIRRLFTIEDKQKIQNREYAHA